MTVSGSAVPDSLQDCRIRHRFGQISVNHLLLLRLHNILCETIYHDNLYHIRILSLNGHTEFHSASVLNPFINHQHIRVFFFQQPVQLLSFPACKYLQIQPGKILSKHLQNLGIVV